MKAHGGYNLERPLGKGATAQVFLARRPSHPEEAPVALKIFHQGIWDRDELKRRALAEFNAVSALQHPNIVRVLAPHWDIEPPAVALEYIDGVSLDEFQGRLPYILPELAVLVLIDVLSGLEEAHRKGIIHRDLKPANILVSHSGRVCVSDFGLAKMTDASRLTLTGTILGSPDFMSPEQARGDVTTPRSDLFSAAAILYFLVTGTRPFSRHSPLATLAAVCEAQPEPAQRRNPKLSGALATILHRGLARKPEDRYESASAFKAALREYLDSIGLTAQTFSLQDWVRAPNDSVLAALRTISETLVQRAESFLARSDWDRLLETISHLSLVAPESATIPRLMEAYEEQQQRRKFGIWFAKLRTPVALSAGLLALSLVILAVSGKMGQTPSSATGAAVPRADVPGADLSATGSDAVATTATDAAVSPLSAPRAAGEAITAISTPKSPPRESRAPAPPRLATVRFDVDDSVAVYWDGQRVNPRQILRRQTEGYHQLRLEKSGLKPIIQRILVTASEPNMIRAR